jgi:hypothetical protein
MPKRKAPVVVAPVADAEDSSDESSNNAEIAPSPKKGKAAPKKAAGRKGKTPVSQEKTADGRGRGRPPLSNEEKAKRDAEKATKSARGRGRPKGATGSKSKTAKK